MNLKKASSKKRPFIKALSNQGNAKTNDRVDPCFNRGQSQWAGTDSLPGADFDVENLRAEFAVVFDAIVVGVYYIRCFDGDDVFGGAEEGPVEGAEDSDAAADEEGGDAQAVQVNEDVLAGEFGRDFESVQLHHQIGQCCADLFILGEGKNNFGPAAVGPDEAILRVGKVAQGYGVVAFFSEGDAVGEG